MVVDLHDYKIAKEFAEDAEYILRIIDITIKGMEHFTHYEPVTSLIDELESTRFVLLSFLASAENILKGIK